MSGPFTKTSSGQMGAAVLTAKCRWGSRTSRGSAFNPGSSVGRASQGSKLQPAQGKACGKDFICFVEIGLAWGWVSNTETVFRPHLVFPKAQ
jgi:hypothetical protein